MVSRAADIERVPWKSNDLEHRNGVWSVLLHLLVTLVPYPLSRNAASPYLVGLGLSKAATSAVFLAGPISGLIVQPLVGALADGTTSRLGRRRPFMLGGTILCACSMLGLSWAREISGGVCLSTNVSRRRHQYHRCSQPSARLPLRLFLCI